MCKCVEELDAKIKEHNTAIVTELFSGFAIVSTYKIDSKKRGKPLAALASFCPFCGEKYPPRKDPFERRKP